MLERVTEEYSRLLVIEQDQLNVERIVERAQGIPAVLAGTPTDGTQASVLFPQG